MFKFKKLAALLMGILIFFSLSACTSSKDNSNSDNNTNNKTQQKNITQEEKIITQYPLTIVDSTGREITLDKEPTKIISAAPSITETIFALGKESSLIGRTDYCDYPAEAAEIASIGTLQEPNIETITEFNPDVVIASTHFKEDVAKKLENLNINVVVINEGENFEGVYKTIEKVGEILNSQNKANEIVNNMKEKVKEVTTKVKDAQKPSVYYVVGFGEYGDYTAGKDTFIGEMIEMAGGSNAASDVEGWKYSLEKLVEKDPNILICSKFFSAKDGIKQANGYKDLTAVKENKLFEIDNNTLDRQGPRLADGLFELAKIIHPELFK